MPYGPGASLCKEKKMQYITVTLSPALDKTYEIGKGLKAGELNRIGKPVISAGGKGINSARMIGVLGGKAVALTFASDGSGRDGYAGEAFGRLLEAEGLETSYIPTAAGVRTNIKLVEPDSRGTELNEPGGPVTKEELKGMMDRLDELSGEISVDGGAVLLGGSIPQGVEKSVYNSMIERIKARKIRVLLDCDGDAFRQGVESRPWLVKPNLYELGLYYSTEFSTIPQGISAAKRFFVETDVNILCTMGEKGAIYAGRDGFFICDAPKITVRGFAGAGDCFAAAFLFTYDSTGGDLPSALRFASAAGAAKTESPGTSMPSLSRIRELASSVSVRQI